jgi:hypothetical protein
MSNFTTTYVSDPLLDFRDLTQSTDPIAIRITSNFRNIYKNYLLFMAENDKNGNVNNLDTASYQIQTSVNDIISLVTPCASNTNPNKCTSSVCQYISEVEQLLTQYFIILTNMTSNDIKINYQFLPFLLLKEISDTITSNQTNYDPINKNYVLCTDGTNYTAKSDNPKLQTLYNRLLNKMTTQQTSRDTRQFDTGLINFLLYILLPTIIFIILILLYIRHVKNSKVQDSTSDNNVQTSSDSIPIANINSTEQNADSKTGGTIFDILGFVTKIGIKLF